MDYGTYVRRAWEITKKHRLLWVLGFFAGGTVFSGGGGGGGSSWREPAGKPSDFQPYLDESTRWAGEHLALLLMVALAVFAVMVVFFIVSLAARGGLYSEVEYADSGREPSLRRGWSTGLSKVGRTFAVAFVTGLPAVAASLAFAFALIASALPLLLAVFSGSDPDWGAVSLVGFLFVLLLGIPVMALVGFVSRIWMQLALCAGILEDRTAGDALSRGWRLFREHLKDSALLGVIEIGLTFAVGLALGVVAAAVAIPAALAAVMGARSGVAVVMLPVGAVLALAAAALAAVVAGASATYFAALWVTFFRDLTGRTEPMPVVAATPPVATWTPREG